MKFTLDGIPIPKARPRFFTYHGQVRTYDPQEKLKNNTQTILKQQLQNALNSPDKQTHLAASELYHAKAYQVTLHFGMPIPSSLPIKRKNLLTWIGQCTTKPDLDNLVKFYLDAANGILWHDDKQIIFLQATKSYTTNPKTTITVMEKQETTLDEECAGILAMFPQTHLRQLLASIMACESILDCKEIVEDILTGQFDPDKRTCSAIAFIISHLADHFAEDFIKIKKKYPNYCRLTRETHNK